ncbi:hypothetical protein SEVIR_8G000500v4 [Setaria viridis]|uniref:Uncharacterized protein n=1 Tax=Setaria viridis TaxID=4556 RepID=A0A4U6TBQ8_SETVI|nr:uncharacterized protein LOC117833885 [Setaria viridis]TKV98821.1 hypothetical protein SEVIR_8G000500v2 [Setaria viridis]
MTAKELKHKGRVERDGAKKITSTSRRFKLQTLLHSSGSDGPKRSVPKGISRSIKSMWKFQASRAALVDFEKKLCDIEEQRFGTLPNREISSIPFEEKPFGDEVACDHEICRFSVVSIALFDGDCVGENMLFACSGIAIPRKPAPLDLTRFVTSAYLVRVFNERRNRDDKLRVQVRLPDGTTTDGLLGLYDHDIAIVTSIGRLDVCPVDLNIDDCPDGLHHARAVGRAFESGRLMAMPVSLSDRIVVSDRLSVSDKFFVSDSQGQGYTEAALGGPLVGHDCIFQGMVIDLVEYGGAACIIEREFLCTRLELLLACDPKKLRSLDYSLPSGVSSIIPSGFMKTIYRLRSFGYPMPPPLVLELNGRLLNRFEERFGVLRAWKGYPFGAPHQQVLERVWDELEGGVVANISRRVVALASFNGYVRSFACTGLLIKWCGSRATHTVVLTSASLVRSRLNEDDIDENLRIEVFLPPNQRCDGTLELYDLHYNIAIVSIKKGFNSIRPEDIFNKGKQKFYKKVVAVGRDTIHGLLMGTIGEVKFSNKDCKLNCKDLHWSTCKIKKVGIGGPLIDFDGSFVGMNFYDGSSATPFLPRSKVVHALRSAYNSILPSERGCNPVGRGRKTQVSKKRGRKTNRWPVPKPYWFHDGLDVDMYAVHKHIGRTFL